MKSHLQVTDHRLHVRRVHRLHFDAHGPGHAGRGAYSAQPPLAPYDLLTITTRDGTQTQITLTKATADFIEGSLEQGALPRHFDLAHVIKIERRELDGVKATFLVIAIAVGVYAIAKAVAEASLANNL